MTAGAWVPRAGVICRRTGALAASLWQMYVGVDLAWSNRARTGLAAVDRAGRLVDSASVTTDDEIVAWVAAHAPVRAAAMDAPLIVTNASGQRDCEREVSRVFGRYGASCHASNLTRPYFNPPRGATIARRLGWTLDPDPTYAAGVPPCIEVYPHPAMVGLFELGSVLPYKAKGGRSFERRRAAFLELLAHLESVDVLGLPANERWRSIRAAVEDATRPMHLERLEDEVDAVFCAHLAWRWREAPESLHLYGTPADGYIVATPPPTHPVSARVATVAGESDDRSTAPVAERPVMTAFEVRGVPATFATAGERPWRAAVHQAAVAAVADDGPLPGRLEVTMHFRLPPPWRSGQGWDLDNLVKPTLDALTPVLGRRAIAGPEQSDDERVDRLVASKRTVREGENTGATILVTVL